MNNIRNYTFDEYAALAQSFHGTVAPGIMIGGFMVDLAYRNLPCDSLYNSVVETSKCLPDAVQLLTPCTIGNGWLKIVEFGRFALSLYDKFSGRGIRIYADYEKIVKWSEINIWFFRLDPEKKRDIKILLEQIKEAGTSILGVQKIQVDLKYFSKNISESVHICPRCKEAYRAGGDSPCPACEATLPESIYYKPVTNKEISL